MVPYIDMSKYDQGGCLHDLFTTQAAKAPNKVAVVTADGKQVKNEKFINLSEKLTRERFSF